MRLFQLLVVFCHSSREHWSMAYEQPSYLPLTDTAP